VDATAPDNISLKKAVSLSISFLLPIASLGISMFNPICKRSIDVCRIHI